jgi:hypothetical protein
LETGRTNHLIQPWKQWPSFGRINRGIELPSFMHGSENWLLVWVFSLGELLSVPLELRGLQYRGLTVYTLKCIGKEIVPPYAASSVARQS